MSLTLKLDSTFAFAVLLLFPYTADSVVCNIRGRSFAQSSELDENGLHERSRRLVLERGVETNSFEFAGLIDLDFNPAFVVCDEYNGGLGLAVSSFHNVGMNPALFGPNASTAGPPFIPFDDDFVAVLIDLDTGEPNVGRLDEWTDFVWPNEARRAPDGMFPFEAVVVPQGWFTVPVPGRLVAFSLESNDITIIHQSTAENPRFYHSVKFVDMDQDGALDIVTVRSGYQVGSSFHPPVGELVWFRNPGANAVIYKQANNFLWEEFVVVEDLGPDVFLDVKDMTGDGIPEIVTNHFFSGMSDLKDTPWYSASRITLYGAPEGESWASVNASSGLRVADLVDDQGLMFSVDIVDLNGDGAYDVLTTNHQFASDPIDGRVLALAPPESGLLFDDPWIVHILKEGIRPTDAPPGQPSFRMAPGIAKSFLSPYGENDKPWIVVSGDEASKAWVLKPTSEPWVFKEELLFDINDYYRENTTKTILQDPFGITISTIGQIGICEEADKVTLYVPVFEATDIHVFQSTNSTQGEASSGLIPAENIEEVVDKKHLSSAASAGISTITILFFLSACVVVVV